MFQGNYCGNHRVRIKPTKNQNEKNYGRRWAYRTHDYLFQPLYLRHFIFDFLGPDEGHSFSAFFLPKSIGFDLNLFRTSILLLEYCFPVISYLGLKLLNISASLCA